MCLLLALLVVSAYVKDVRSEDFCKIDTDTRVQYCFDPSFINGLRRCNTYEPTGVIHRPGCNLPSQYTNYTVPTPKRCVDGKWVDINNCKTGPQCTWKGAAGKCVDIYRCLSAVEDILKKVPPPICAYQDNKPQICCTDCSLVNDTRQILFNKRLGYLYKNGKKAHDKCIDFINELDYPCSTDGGKSVEWVLDGRKKCFNAVEQSSGGALTSSEVTPANRNNLSHLALLGYGSDVQSLKWLCGGSLISHNFILTTAHCAESRKDGPVTYVALGIERWSDPVDKWQRYKVKTIIIHPDYQPPSQYNDITLLETDTPVLFKGVLPACLHVDEDLDDKATIISLGSALVKHNLGDTPLPITQHKYNDDICMSKYPPGLFFKNGYDRNTQLCYGDEMGIQSTCLGVSGGSLYSKEHYPGRCVFTILGVLSISKGCMVQEDSQSLYTRVQNYVPWIESIVWP